MNNPAPIHEILEEGRRLFAESQHLHERIEELHLEDLASRAGALHQELRMSRCDAERNLGHPSPQIRAVALEVLYEQWHARDMKFAEKCRSMMQCDSDMDVRGLAAQILGQLHENTNDIAVGRSLAEMLKDATLPDESRHSVLWVTVGRWRIRKGA